MIKGIGLILMALGANVNAEDVVAEMLVDRASNSIYFVDMDDAVLGKAAKGSGGAAPPAQRQTSFSLKSRNYGGTAQQNKIFSKKVEGKRIFGGTNNRWNKDPAIMAKLKGKAAGMYGDVSQKSQLAFTGGGPLKVERFGEISNTATRKTAPKVPLRKITYFATPPPPKKRLFGGTNNIHNKNPAVMAKLGPRAAGMYNSDTKDYRRSNR
jgi:hypothetical protein